ncbi:MAG: hypothetical protein Rhob2KO_14600 [Rhodopirellula baltica]
MVGNQRSSWLFDLRNGHSAEQALGQPTTLAYRNLLIDGHNRYEICTRLGIEYSVSEMQFDCRDDAEDWIDRNQAGKRNLSPASFRIVSGRIYNRRKKQHGGDRKSKCQVGTLDGSEDAPVAEDTAAEVAQELGVSERTIHRNGQRAALHDEMLDIGDEEAAEAVKTLPQAGLLLQLGPRFSISPLLARMLPAVHPRPWQHHMWA